MRLYSGWWDACTHTKREIHTSQWSRLGRSMSHSKAEESDKSPHILSFCHPVKQCNCTIYSYHINMNCELTNSLIIMKTRMICASSRALWDCVLWESPASSCGNEIRTFNVESQGCHLGGKPYFEAPILSYTVIDCHLVVVKILLLNQHKLYSQF